MKVYIIALLAASWSASLLAEQNPVAVVVTCKTQPGAKRPDFLALAKNCDQKQLACDQYKDDPYYGPATAGACEPEYNLTRLKGTLLEQFKRGRRFPGSAGSVILCKTKAEGNIFAMQGDTCKAEEQTKVCDKYGADIAEPSSCALYTSQDWVEAKVHEHLPSYGFECQLQGSGVPFRLAAPDCSTALTNAICNPSAGKVLACKKWDDRQALKRWAEEIPMKGFVTCRLNELPTKTVSHIPARDCTVEAGKDACGVWGTPLACEVKDIEALRQEMIRKQAEGK